MTIVDLLFAAAAGYLLLRGSASRQRPAYPRHRHRRRGGVLAGLALGELMRAGELRLRPNPAAEPLAPEDERALRAAEQMALEFHGPEGLRQVIELGPGERRLPRFVVATGQLADFTYEPRRGSARGGTLWTHETTDRGPLAPRAKHTPVLAADPETGRPIVVPMSSPMRLDPARGWVG